MGGSSDPAQGGSRLGAMATKTVTSWCCTPAHVSSRALGCTLRVPPAAMKPSGGTVTHEEYDAWDAEDLAKRGIS
jgi:hypothetical protein